MRGIWKNTGIVLLEVLLAVTIMGIGMGTIFLSLSESARLQSWVQRKATARQLASDQMLRMRTSRSLRQTGEVTGGFDAPYADYVWKAQVQQAIDPPFQSHITLSVQFGPDKTTLYSLETYLLK